MSPRILLQEEDEQGSLRATQVIEIEGPQIRMRCTWQGTAIGVRTLPIPTVDQVMNATIRETIQAGKMPILDLKEQVEISGPYHDLIHAKEDQLQHRPPAEGMEAGPLRLRPSEAQALIAYFLIPPPLKALTPGALDAIRTGTLDPEGFYELAIPTKPPNEFCRAEAFAWTMGLVLKRFRSHYV